MAGAGALDSVYTSELRIRIRDPGWGVKNQDPDPG
jgi:hypothetical protein